MLLISFSRTHKSALKYLIGKGRLTSVQFKYKFSVGLHPALTLNTQNISGLTYRHCPMEQISFLSFILILAASYCLTYIYIYIKYILICIAVVTKEFQLELITKMLSIFLL